MKVDITVISRPSEIEFNCPYCEEDIEINYSTFNDDLGGNIYDWCGSTFDCPGCGERLEVDDVDWD